MKLKVCSLFSGIGGFEEGIINALGKENVEFVFSSEVDENARFFYQHYYDHRLEGDITKINENDIPSHDLLVGGFPCQAFSIGGKRLGFSDTRGTLFFEIARIAKEKQPQTILLENVKGLINHNEGNTLRTILITLSNLGYSVDFDILNSQNFGVPQSRERIFIVAMKNKTTEQWTLGKKINVLHKAKKSLMNDTALNTFNFSFPSGATPPPHIKTILEDLVLNPYTIKGHKRERFIIQIKNFQTPDFVYLIDDQGRLRKKLKPLTVSPTIRREMHGNEPKIVFHSKEQIYIRRMTPLECLRVQGFDDKAYFTMKKLNISDSQIYKMAGNAVTTNVISALIRKIYPSPGM